MTFLNLTNHPSANWPAPQTEAAFLLADKVFIKDYPFPRVDPSATTGQIDGLADEIVTDVGAQHEASETTIHLSGEYTLTVALVARFQGLGFRVVSSTTERLVSVNEQGDRTIKFSFVQFRDYAPLYVESESI